MPNPFPGMDPYLEGDLWTSVHTDLCAAIAQQLAAKIPSRYVIRNQRRIVIAPPDETELPQQRLPDVGVFDTSAREMMRASVGSTPKLSRAVASRYLAR